MEREVNSRLIDDEDDDYHWNKSSKQSKRSRAALVDDYDGSTSGGKTYQPLVDADGFQQVTKTKKKMKAEIRKQLKDGDRMSRDEVERINDLFGLSHRDR